jgi:hypothetical protein
MVRPNYTASPPNCHLIGAGTGKNEEASPALWSNNPSLAPSSNQLFIPGTCIVTLSINQQSFTMTIQITSVESECNAPTYNIHYFDASGKEISQNELISLASGGDMDSGKAD